MKFKVKYFEYYNIISLARPPHWADWLTVSSWSKLEPGSPSSLQGPGGEEELSSVSGSTESRLPSEWPER